MQGTSSAIETFEEENLLRKLITGAVIATATFALGRRGHRPGHQPGRRHHVRRDRLADEGRHQEEAEVASRCDAKLDGQPSPARPSRSSSSRSARASSSAARASRSAKDDARSPAARRPAPPARRPARRARPPRSSSPGNAAARLRHLAVRRRTRTRSTSTSTPIRRHRRSRTSSRARSRTAAARCGSRSRRRCASRSAGLDATLTAIDQTFTGKAGKNYIVTSTNCKNKKVKVKGTLDLRRRASTATPGPRPSRSPRR